LVDNKRIVGPYLYGRDRKLWSCRFFQRQPRRNACNVNGNHLVSKPRIHPKLNRKAKIPDDCSDSGFHPPFDIVVWNGNLVLKRHKIRAVECALAVLGV